MCETCRFVELKSKNELPNLLWFHPCLWLSQIRESLINFCRAVPLRDESPFSLSRKKHWLFNNKIFARTYPFPPTLFQLWDKRVFIEDQISARYISSLIPDICACINAHCQRRFSRVHMRVSRRYAYVKSHE